MKLMKIAAAAAALALTAAPAMAQATSADSVQRIGASASDENELAGSNILFGVLAVAAIIGAIIVIADGDDEDEAVSP